MKKYNHPALYGLIITFLSLSIVIAVQSSVKRNRYNTQQPEGFIKPIDKVEDLKVVNKTSNFIVTEIKKNSDKIFEIIFKNQYSKRITGFEISIAGTRVQTELILGGDEQEFIPPGSVYPKAYAAQAELYKYGIQILAVMFDDGSSDGDITYIKEIKDYRLGIKIERERVLSLLEPIINSKNQDTSTALEAMEAQLSATLPLSQQTGKLDNIGLGVRNEKQRILDEIRMLISKHQSVQSSEEKNHLLKEDLSIFKEMYKDIINLASR